MKRILLVLCLLLALTGCKNQAEENSIMVKSAEYYALFAHDGEQLSKYIYKSFQEIELGYIVTDASDQIGVIADTGRTIVPFGEYETIEAVDRMLYATKKSELEPVIKDGYYYSHLYLLDDYGQVIYAASEQCGIKKSGLPIIHQNDEYQVLCEDGIVLETSKDPITYVSEYQDCNHCVICYGNLIHYYEFLDDETKLITYEGTGQYDIRAVGNNASLGTILYDKNTKTMLYVNRETSMMYPTTIALTDVYYDDVNNIIIENNLDRMIYKLGLEPIKLNTYYMNASTYLVRSSEVYGPHKIYNEGVLVDELNNVQLYPSATQIDYPIFPVYVKNTGYQFYNFKNELVFDYVYDDAEPFDVNSRAIVSTLDSLGYSLINETGITVSKQLYSSIKYIGGSYYAVYNESGKFGVINSDGKEIFPIEFTDLPENAFFEYNDERYMMLSKNGRGYVYDVNDEMEVVFSKEGDISFDSKGFFVVDDIYYTFKGERMN